MKYFFNPQSERGVTLIEIMAVVVITAVFSAILIADFPKAQKSLYLTRAAYKMAQDLRKAQNLSLSGAYVDDGQGGHVPISGYGISIDTDTSTHQYLIYADSCDPFDFQYTPPGELCSGGDYIVDTVDMSKDGPEVYIKELQNVDGNQTSIDFTPPNPVTNIQNATANEITVVLGITSDPTQTRQVIVNTSGLIEVQ